MMLIILYNKFDTAQQRVYRNGISLLKLNYLMKLTLMYVYVQILVARCASRPPYTNTNWLYYVHFTDLLPFNISSKNPPVIVPFVRLSTFYLIESVKSKNIEIREETHLPQFEPQSPQEKTCRGILAPSHKRESQECIH